MEGDKLTFWWPKTGKLTVKIRGNESATMRFMPSLAAVEEGLRITGVEPRHGVSALGQPHTHSDGKEAFCALHGDFRAHSDFQITEQGDIITQEGCFDAKRPLFDTEDTDMIAEKLGRYEKYAARYNQHLQSGQLGCCGEDLYLMAAVLRQEGARRDELKALMLSFYFDLSGTGSGPAINRNTAKRAREAVAAASIGTHEMEEMYLDTIQKDTVPAPVMSVRDSLYIFELCLDGRHDEAEEILGHFVDDARK